MYLSHKRIEDYLKIIYKHKGLWMSFAVMDYIIIVLGKNLQMMVAYSLYNSDFDRVTQLFEQFNEQYSNYMSVFQRVTSQEFIAGRGLEGAQSRTP